MEEESEPNISTVHFFEGLLRHAPVRELLIKQFTLLDSLTLIRLAKASPFLNDYIRNNAELWVPKIKQYSALIKGFRDHIDNTIVYYEKSTAFTELYQTSLLFYLFPSFIDLYLFLVAVKPHVWVGGISIYDKATPRHIITCQDWTAVSKHKKHSLNKLFDEYFYISNAHVWTQSTSRAEKGFIHNQVYSSWVDNQKFHEVYFMPRIGYIFKYSKDDASFILTSRLPQKPWPRCEIHFSIVTRFDNGRKSYFVFDNYNIFNISASSAFKRDVIELFEDEVPRGIAFMLIKNARTRISLDFSVTFFISFVAFRVYVFFEDMLQSKFEKYQKKISGMNKNNDDVILVVEQILPVQHYTKEDQTEFLIESCIECQGPAQAKCSGCLRAVYCGEECAKKGWENSLHSKMCKHISKLNLEK